MDLKAMLEMAKKSKLWAMLQLLVIRSVLGRLLAITGWKKRPEEVPAPDARVEVVSLIRKKERLMAFGAKSHEVAFAQSKEDEEQSLKARLQRKDELRELEVGPYSAVSSQAICRCLCFLGPF